MNNDYNELAFILTEDNPYTILGVTEDTNLEEISQIYRYLAKHHHPDKNIHLRGTHEFKEKEAVFQKITNAYNLLKDPEERKKFDHQERIRKEKEEARKQVQQVVNISDTQPGELRKSDFMKDTLTGFTFSQVQAMDSMQKEEQKRQRLEKEKAVAFEQLELAKRLLTLQKYDESIIILRPLTEKYSKEAQFHSYLGLAMQGKGWTGYAQAEFKVALHHDPKDPVALKHYKTAEIQKTEPNLSAVKPKKEEQQTGMFDKFKSFFKK